MAEEITLQGLFQQILQTQAEVDALEAEYSGIKDQTKDNTDDINDLKTPPAAVPPGLLDWYAAGHTTTEVDPPLASWKTTTDASVAGVASELAVTQAELDAESAARADADDALATSVDDVQTQVADNLGKINDNTAAIGELHSSAADSYDTINLRVDGVAADIATETSARQTQTNSLNSQVATLSSAAQMHNTQIQQLSGVGVDPEGALASQITELTVISNDAATATAAETTARMSADTALQNSINGMSGQISSNTSQIAAEASARQSADVAHDSDIDTINTRLDGHDSDITAEESTRAAADAAITSDIVSVETGIADAQADIAQEITDRTNADAAIQAQLDSNTADTSDNTDAIEIIESQVTPMLTKYGLLIDGLGYITGYEDLGEAQPDSKFLVKDLNHNVRIQNPSFVGQYLAPVTAVAFQAPVSFDADWAGPTTNVFSSLDTLNHTRNVKVYSAGSLVALNGSTFLGPAYGTGGSLQRLSGTPVVFKVRVAGAVSRYLSLWYRIKATPADTTQAWYPAVMTDNQIPAARAYEQVSAEAVIQVSMPVPDTVIEFGFTILNTQDATTGNLNDMIYGGCASIEAFNLTTVA